MLDNPHATPAPDNFDVTIDGVTVPLTQELLERYDVPGPRYTSYPTAPMWSDDFGAADARRVISASNETGAPLSLYMHLPFCERLCLFCGCNVIVSHKHDKAEPYLATLMRELELLADVVDTSRPVVQFHWGGGTPTYFTPEQLERLFTFTQERFTFADDAEIGVEIDPRVTTDEHLTMLRRVGFNRLSMGVQDFDPAVQEAIRRIQTVEQVGAMVERCRELGFDSVNLDLIYGLPLQTAAGFARTLEHVVALDPDRIAMFSYGHVPWIKKQQRVLTDLLPTHEEKFRIFRTGISHLTNAGYTYVGMDHFARPDDELCVAQRDGTLHRNFQGYTTKAGADLLGAGITSIGQIGHAYTQNRRDVDGWRAAIENDELPCFRGIELNDDDVIRQDAIGEILCHTALDKVEFGRRHGIDVDSYFAESLARLKPLADDGLVTLDDDAIRATPLGRIFLRNIAMAFDAYLDRPSDRPMFSRTL
ncbi:MAG: oxygen-independent coproporphyrinogen III oxidase [Propionibacteriaceae bacterium]|nr:oxygen-independent coproporphyrinogen III oxidase [Propionibacteriaceae bacterium]